MVLIVIGLLLAVAAILLVFKVPHATYWVIAILSIGLAAILEMQAVPKPVDYFKLAFLGVGAGYLFLVFAESRVSRKATEG